MVSIVVSPMKFLTFPAFPHTFTSKFLTNFKIFAFKLSQLIKKCLKLSIMVGELFEIHLSQLTKNSLKLSTMVGENFEIHLSQLTKNALNYPPCLEKCLKFTCLN